MLVVTVDVCGAVFSVLVVVFVVVLPTPLPSVVELDIDVGDDLLPPLPPLEEVKLLPVPVVFCVSVLKTIVSDVVGGAVVDFVCLVWIGEVTTVGVVEIIVGILLPVEPMPVFFGVCVDEVEVIVTELVCVLVPDVTVGFRGAVFPVPVVVLVVGVVPTLLPGVVELDVDIDAEVNLQKVSELRLKKKIASESVLYLT